MFGPTTKLLTIMGFDVKLDFSWVFIATLVVWSLAKGYFPDQVQGLSGDVYWAMAVVGMLGLFFSIVFHELAHSMVARIYGLEIKGITLFIFGGMAEMKNEPANATTEFMVAVAGPLSSFFLSGVFYLITIVGAALSLAPAIIAVFAYLAFINTVLAVFNLVPAFPMDGGRVLRAILWYRLGDMNKATHIAAQGGYYFGLFLIILGVFSILTGNFVSGMWAALIGMFVQRAASAEDFRSDVRDALGHQSVQNFMTRDPVVVEAELMVQDLVDDYFYRYHHDMFPVMSKSELVGCVTIRDVKTMSRDNWQTKPVSEIMKPCNGDNTIDVDTLAVEAIAQMGRTNNGRMIVVQGGQLVGILALKDLLGIMTIRKELRGQD